MITDQPSPTLGMRPNQHHWAMHGLIGWWPLFEGGGTTVQAVEGSLDPVFGTLTTATSWATIDDRIAIVCDGVDDLHLITCSAKIPRVPVTGSFSLWANRTGDGVGQDILLSFGPVDQSGRRLRFDADAGNFRYAYANINTTDTGENFTDGQWHHLAMVWSNDGADFLRVYFDGKLAADTTNAGATFADPPEITLGNYQADAHEFNGHLSDCRFWERALGHAEIMDLYHHPWAPFYQQGIVVPHIGEAVAGGAPLFYHHLKQLCGQN